MGGYHLGHMSQKCATAFEGDHRTLHLGHRQAQGKTTQQLQQAIGMAYMSVPANLVCASAGFFLSVGHRPSPGMRQSVPAVPSARELSSVPASLIVHLKLFVHEP